jgi:hypothetical protein
MDILTSNELNSIGVFPDRSTKLVFKGREFVLGPSFSLSKKSAGISFCAQEEKDGHRCLLVESSSSITVWKCVKNEQEEPPDYHLSTIEREMLIDNCLLELTKCVGPMATLIIEDLKGEVTNMSRAQVINIVAEQIPDTKLALAFVQSMN